uniref:Uncharacterized protein n=1 Tax=Panagrolaimus sp. JU765 TaxID=591449 RepID=A0AC34QMD4_9BILA
MTENVEENLIELTAGPSGAWTPMDEEEARSYPYASEPFKFELDEDEMDFPFVLNIRPKSRAPKKLDYIPRDYGVVEITGSRKRKASAYEGYKPQKYDGKQFRHCVLQGNETAEQILEMKRAALDAVEFGEEFYKKQTAFCLNYLKRFVKERMNKKELEWKERVEHHALRMYETVIYDDLPTDIPEIAMQMLRARTRKLEAEFTKVRDYAEGCVDDIMRNSFERNGAGRMRAQKFVISESLTEVRKEKPYIPPNFDAFSEESAYRIISYYNLPCTLTDPESMRATVKKHFEKGIYVPMEEILQALGTARLGLNDLEFPNRSEMIDEIYANALLNIPEFEMEEESSSPEGSPAKKHKKQHANAVLIYANALLNIPDFEMEEESSSPEGSPAKKHKKQHANAVLVNSDSAERIDNWKDNQTNDTEGSKTSPAKSPKKSTPMKSSKSTRGRGGSIRGRKRGISRGAKRGT